MAIETRGSGMRRVGPPVLRLLLLLSAAGLTYHHAWRIPNYAARQALAAAAILVYFAGLAFGPSTSGPPARGGAPRPLNEAWPAR